MNEIRDIHEPFKSLLRLRGIPFVYHRPDCRSGIRKGWPDFTLVCSGQALAIECKTDAGKQSVAQIEVMQELRRTGTRYEICRSFEECSKVATEWLSHLPAVSTLPEPQTALPEPPRAKEKVISAPRLCIGPWGNNGDFVFSVQNGKCLGMVRRAVFPRDASLPRLSELVK